MLGQNLNLVLRIIGNKFLHPGPGYGGSCFPKDTIALVKTAKDYDIEIPIIESVVDYNLQRKKSLGNKIFKLMNGKIKNKKISILGLSFKFSPFLRILRM